MLTCILNSSIHIHHREKNPNWYEIKKYQMPCREARVYSRIMLLLPKAVNELLVPNIPLWLIHCPLLLLLLLKKVGSAKLRESGIHPISPMTPASQYQPIDRKKRKWKKVEDYSRDRTAWANKEALALLLKPPSPTPSNTGLARSFQRDTEKGIKVLLYCKVLQRGGA